MNRFLLGAIFAALVFGTAPALAHHPDGGTPQSGDVVDGPVDTSDVKQHGGDEGHLPVRENVELVGKLDTLTNVEGGIADVGCLGATHTSTRSAPNVRGAPGARAPASTSSTSPTPQPRGRSASSPPSRTSYVGEGIHVIDFGGRDILVHNNETCDASQPVISGFAVWDVTEPPAPSSSGQFGDTTPAAAGQTFHTTHSVQAFTWQGRPTPSPRTTRT